MLERGGARWKAVRTAPHRFDAAERGATSETAIVRDCRLLYSADVRGSRRAENALPADTGGESAPQWPERAGLGRP